MQTPHIAAPSIPGSVSPFYVKPCQVHPARMFSMLLMVIPPRQSFNLLFSVASGGKLASWRSVRALIGAPAEAEVERLAELADDCT